VIQCVGPEFKPQYCKKKKKKRETTKAGDVTAGSSQKDQERLEVGK
jgi:hypothetical protein